MRPLNQQHLYFILNQLTVTNRTIDMSEYTIPKGKRLLLRWEGNAFGDDITNILHVAVHDGAGSNGDQQLLELSDNEDVIFDAFFDDYPNDIETHLKLIDCPFK